MMAFDCVLSSCIVSKYMIIEITAPQLGKDLDSGQEVDYHKLLFPFEI